jgi:hypothetical protein
MIGIQQEDGKIKAIYCHYDGYPEGVGQTLANYYQTTDKVEALLNLGDLSVLRQELGEKQDFNDYKNHDENWCLAYGRDRGSCGCMWWWWCMWSWDFCWNRRVRWWWEL